MNVGNPYAPPASPPGFHSAGGSGAVRRDGEALVVPRGAPIPDVCLRCGVTHGLVRRKTKLQWTPVWARVLLVLCALPGLVAFLVSTKRAELDLPLCGPCNARWTAARNAIIAAVVILFSGFFAARTFEDSEVAVGLAVVGLLALMGAVVFARGRMLGVRRIDDVQVELVRVAPNAMAALFR